MVSEEAGICCHWENYGSKSLECLFFILPIRRQRMMLFHNRKEIQVQTIELYSVKA